MIYQKITPSLAYPSGKDPRQEIAECCWREAMNAVGVFIKHLTGELSPVLAGDSQGIRAKFGRRLIYRDYRWWPRTGMESVFNEF